VVIPPGNACYRSSGLRDPGGTDNLSGATKPKAYIMTFDSLSADPFGHTDLAIKNAGIPNVAPLTSWHKHRRPATACAAAMLAFAAGLLVAAVGTWAADEPARPRPSVERAGANSVRFQATAEQFAPPNQPDISASDARFIDQLYRELIGPPSAASSSSRLRAAPNNGAAGSVRRWGPR
jgi:hypothetical protein